MPSFFTHEETKTSRYYELPWSRRFKIADIRHSVSSPCRFSLHTQTTTNHPMNHPLTSITLRTPYARSVAPNHPTNMSTDSSMSIESTVVSVFWPAYWGMVLMSFEKIPWKIDIIMIIFRRRRVNGLHCGSMTVKCLLQFTDTLNWREFGRRWAAWNYRCWFMLLKR